MPTTDSVAPAGRSMPSLGLGTWRMGEAPTTRSAESAAVRFST